MAKRKSEKPNEMPTAVLAAAADSKRQSTGKSSLVEPDPDLAEATGSIEGLAQLQLLIGVLRATSASADPTMQQEKLQTAIALLKGIKPEGELEGMLAAQMVATHTSAMECLRASVLTNQTLYGRDMNLRHAEKLLALYARQLEVLDKHRGKGQQQVTVKYMNVHPGGQAVVGNVQPYALPSEANAEARRPPALADQSGSARGIVLVTEGDEAPIRCSEDDTAEQSDGAKPPAKHRADDLKPALRREDPQRPTLHGPGSSRQEALPHARRRKGIGRATRKPERA